ncbi:MAG: bifunctional folylpolyglutamate synthase/dihydrofolate synthase [Oceanidesulfovibrio sp.]
MAHTASHFASAAAFEDYLDRLGLFHMDLTLARIESCLSRLGLDTLPYPAIQVVGTNGKGTTSTLIARMAAAHGLRAGLYTSPHFLHPRERIRFIEPAHTDTQGATERSDCISEKAWRDAANAVHPAQEEEPLTYFEYITVLAAHAFRGARVDLAVFEAGLGGRNDATTALRCPTVCFTRIGLDHTHILGRDLEDVAADKAAAMPSRGTALTIRQQETARFILDREAIKRGTRLLEVRPPQGMASVAESGNGSDEPLSPEDALAQLPAMLRENGRLAIAAWAHLATTHGWPFETDAVRDCVGRSMLPGRFQHVYDNDAWFLLDAAHNPQAMEALALSMAEQGIVPRAVVFACLADKDLEAMAAVLAKAMDGTAHVPELPGVERALPAQDICRALRNAGLEATPHPDTAASLTAACAESEASKAGARRPVLVCGSLYLLAGFFTLRPNLLGSANCGES